ncbi:chaperone protein dnaJ 11, chloroplastic-like [Canna indica]|uniref:Chaperone protein dnaJ 11, chloroplastic-like n=1 Tax=Canna indica TaxID=4628 RepID=A0AAQ3KS10_9LILI|nr:chaperone protein dnaJ 11, chloroplastic-like [Canna indica]
MAEALIFAGICLPSGCGGRGVSVRPRVVTMAAAGGRAKSMYEVLRVRETATAGEIKAAYRSMAKQFHPDVAAGRGGDHFMEIHRAYEALSDPAARARYDISIGRWRPGAERLRSRRWETDQCW